MPGDVSLLSDCCHNARDLKSKKPSLALLPYLSFNASYLSPKRMCSLDWSEIDVISKLLWSWLKNRIWEKWKRDFKKRWKSFGLPANVQSSGYFPLVLEVKQALQMLATCIFSIPQSSACITSLLPIVQNLNLPRKFDASSPLTLTLTREKTKKTTKFQKKILWLMNFPRIPCVALVLRRG